MNSPLFRLSFSLIVWLFLMAPLANAQKWTTHTDYDNNYTIQFPELPNEVYKNVPEGFKTTTYAQSAACTYMSKILIMKSESKDPEGKAKKTMNASAEKVGGKVIEQEAWELGGATGIKSVIEVPDQGKGKPKIKMLCNVIVVGKVQYQLVAMGPAELFEDAVADHFLATFRFLN